jgi:hypothetical protein
LNNQPLGETANSIEATLAGEYELFVSNTLYACSDTTEAFDLMVNPLPNVQALGSDMSICIGVSVLLNGQGATSYSWNNSVVDNVAFAPNQTADYVVIGTDANNCTTSDTLTVVVNALPTVIANVNHTEICKGESVVFSGAGAQSYTWNNGILNGLSMLLNQTDSYIVQGTNSNGCVNSDTVTVVVNENPVISIGNDTTVCENHLPLVLNGPAGFDSYSWNTNETASTINANQSSTYVLTVEDQNGCSGSASLTLTVDGCLGIEELEASISVYPNPTNGLVTIQFDQFQGDYQIELIDAFGKVIEQKQSTSSETMIDLSNYATGVYTIKIASDEFNVLKRLVKE